MLQQLQSLLVLCYDAVYMLVGIICAIFESIFHIFKPPAMKPVRGEIALVVGAGHGIGREFAVQLASLGAIVICWDVDEEANQATAEAARAACDGHCKVYTYYCDISDREQILQVAQLVQTEVGEVSFLIHFGSVPSSRPSASLSVAELSQDASKAMTNNVFSHFWVLEAFLPYMTKVNHGHVVLLTCATVVRGITGQMGLRTSQLAVLGLAESLTEELRVTHVSGVHITLAHVPPFIISPDLHNSLSSRVPRYYGMPGPKEAAYQILKAARRNYTEVSVPHYLFYLGNIFQILPPNASKMLQEVLDIGVEAC